MAVEINIDLDSTKAHGKIQALRADLKSLNDDVDIDFDKDDSLKESIQKLTRELRDIHIDVDYRELEQAAALKAALHGDINSDLNVNTDKAVSDIEDGLDPPDPIVTKQQGPATRFGDDGTSGIDHDGQAKKFTEKYKSDRFTRALERFKRYGEAPRKPDGSFAPSDYRRKFLEDHRPEPRLREFQKRMGNFGTQPRDGSGRFRSKNYFKDFLKEQRELNSKIGDPRGLGNYDPERLGRMRRRMSDWDGIDFDPDWDSGSSAPTIGGGGGLLDNRNTRRSSRMFGGLKKKLASLIPSMTTFYNLLAVLIPILVVFIAQALGAAVAMGAVAVAGASIIGLGLVGHGEDMASSWENAKEQVKELGEEMFNVFQPTMQTFAPIQERVFDALPGQLNEVASAMELLTVYSDTVMASLGGLTSWLAGGMRGMAAMEEQISQLALRFGEILGRNIGAFFKWLIVEAYQSQQMLIKLGAAFRDLMIGAYHVFKVIVRVVLALKPLASIFKVVGGLLDNTVIVAVLTFATVLGLVVYTVMGLTSAMAGLIGLWSVGLIETVLSSIAALDIYIFKILSATAMNYGLAASLATVVSFLTLGVGTALAFAAAMSAVDGIKSEMEMTTGGFAGGGSGGFPGGGMGGGAGGGTTQTVINEGNTYNMEVNGNVDNPTEQGLKDMISSEGSVSKSRQTPGGT